MRFGPIDSFILIGGGPTLFDLAIWLKSQNLRVTVVTAPRHAVEQIDPTGGSLVDELNRSSVSTVIVDDINDYPDIVSLVHDRTLGIAIGPAWIFRKFVLDCFAGRLVNFHGIRLPRTRGGAHFTWQILTGDKTGGCNIQLVERKLDAGSVIKNLEYRFSATARIPQDYFDESGRRDVLFLREFINEVLAEEEFEPIHLQESFSTYFPRLNTLEHGWIDWSWSTEEIERFICAFDAPYKGASTLLKGRRVFVKSCSAEYDDGAFHPYQSGLVYRKSADAIFVATTDGAISIRSTHLEDGANGLRQVRVGDRLHTPGERLDAALSNRANYDAQGLRWTDDGSQAGTAPCS
jgi:methionyl-tRNA formyltransferase